MCVCVSVCGCVEGPGEYVLRRKLPKIQNALVVGEQRLAGVLECGRPTANKETKPINCFSCRIFANGID